MQQGEGHSLIQPERLTQRRVRAITMLLRTSCNINGGGKPQQAHECLSQLIGRSHKPTPYTACVIHSVYASALVLSVLEAWTCMALEQLIFKTSSMLIIPTHAGT